MAERFGQQAQPEDAALRLFHAALARGRADDVQVHRGPMRPFEGLPPPRFHHPQPFFMPRPDPDRARGIQALAGALRADQGGQVGNEVRAQPAQRPVGRGNWFAEGIANLRARLARLFGEAIPDVPVGPAGAAAAAENVAREPHQQRPPRADREMPPGVLEALGRENRPLPLDAPPMNLRPLRPRADANAALHLAQFPAAAVPDIIEEDFAMRQALLQEAQRDFAEAMRHLNDLPLPARRGLIEVLDDLHNLAGNLRRPIRDGLARAEE